jgi:hypothetical protein
MTDKDWLWTAGVGVALLVLWWLAHRASVQAGPSTATNPNQQAFPVSWDQPLLGPFAANPDFNSPPTNANLSINIQNPFAALLASAYMPLFGFVGIAQGVQFE